MRNKGFRTRRLQRINLKRLREWAGAFAGVRFRLLVWYFLLTLCITLISVWATFKIFCELEQQQAGERLQRDISALEQRIVQTNSSDPSPNILTEMLEQFTQSQVDDQASLYFSL